MAEMSREELHVECSLGIDTSFSVLYRQFDMRDECDSATRQIVGHELAYNAQVLV